MRRFFTAALAAAFCVAAASAGQVTTFQFEEREPGQDEARTGSMYFRDNMMRMEPASGVDEDEPGVIIFRGDKQLLWVIDVEKKSYFQMDRETVERMSDRISAAMKQYEAQLAQLPPQQREMAEKMLKGRLPQAAPKAKVEIRETGLSEVVDGYECRIFEVYRGPDKDSEVCAAELPDIQGADDFSALLRAVGEFWEPLIRSFPGGEQPGEIDFAALGGLRGFPIRVRNYDSAGRLSNEVRMTRIEVRDLPDALFEVDPEYRLRDPFAAGR